GARSNCFLTVVPQPNGFPDDPTGRVTTDSVFSLRFSEPMDPASLTAFDSVTLTRTSFDPDVPTATSSFVVGTVNQTADLSGVTFTPQQLLAHTQGLSESYFLRVADALNDVFPPRDLAGNVVERIPEIRITVEPDDLSALNGGRVSRFTSIDEELPEGAEFGGQVLIDTTRQLLRPRPVVRNQVIIDNSQPILQQMTFLPGGLGVITPHTPFGSKMQHIWRYADCSFALLDQLDHNVDVEGLGWAPNGGTIQPDSFDQFEIRLAHSRWTPDEDINPSNAWPRFPFSGLDDIYLNNIVASAPSDLPAQVTVHDRSLGYNLDPGDLETASTGLTFMPFPLNRDVAPEQRRYFTWRDCDNRARGGGGNAPVDPRAYWIALGINPGSQPVVYSPGQVQTVGLPLLMEYRVIPDASAIGINGWDFNIAVNSSSRPYFRSFSSGGINQSGTTVTVNPDQESTASGGFAPGSNPPGSITPGQDNVVHLGAIDLITRVSHSNSIWFSPDIAGEDDSLPFPGRVYQQPTIEPGFDDQPAGTELIVRFRGATDINYDDSATPGIDNDAGEPNVDELTDYQVDAFTLDCYGDYYNDLDFPVSHNRVRANPGLNFVGADDFWRDSVDEIRDARFYQVRLTFVGNPENGQSAEVSAFALTWSQP
ncbi:MAG: Ig-like domain-containing protein, partial [Planctomycetota bacterium]|nr:Ig-like domain-containing protein [Planctomycetota bacterium]